MPGERFNVRLLPEEEGIGTAERVLVEVGLEGFNILDSSGSRNLRKYPLHHISRWSARGSSLVLFTRSPVDVEDRSVTLQGDDTTIRSVLDTLTCSCMQMAEMLQNGQGPNGAGQAAANSLNALLKKSKKPALLTADQVEFWRHPEKAGWMHSQGEHIKTWRKRWFVLKQGFLFRFASSDVGPSSKARGIVDLSTVTDVADGGATTGRPNSIKLSTATGHISYLCENETSQVEWISALEGAVAKIIKIVAGVDDEELAPAAAIKPKSWAEQLERTYASVGSGSSSRRGGDGDSGYAGSAGGGGGGGGSIGGGSGGGRAGGSSRSQMVSIVNYESPSGAGSGAGRHAGSSGAGAGTYGGGGGGASSDFNYVTVDYGSIAGANAVTDSGPAAAYGGSGAGFGESGNGGGGYGGASSSGYGTASGSGTGSYGGGYAYGQQPQQQPQQPPAAAYAYPQQQQQAATVAPGYGQQPGAGYGSGNLMDAVTAPQAAQQSQSGSPWQVHYTAEGRPYFYNAQTGVTQWNAPA